MTKFKNKKSLKALSLKTCKLFKIKCCCKTVEIQVNASYTLQVAHNIAEAVHEDIEENFPKVKHIMVHVNPAN